MEHSPLPWIYRPWEYDDWGLVRDRYNVPCAEARYEPDTGAHDLARHRENKTDPCKGNGDFIVMACNSFYDLYEVVYAMANFDGRNNNAALKNMAKQALIKNKILLSATQTNTGAR